MKRAHGRRVHYVFSNYYCILLEATYRGQGVCNAQLRISESKDISNPLISCALVQNSALQTDRENAADF